MMKKFKKQINNEKGLTLIELLAVIVILAIIAAIAVPAIGSVISNSRDKAILADASNILAGTKIAVVDGVCDPESTDNLCDQDSVGSEYVEGLTVKGDAADPVTYKVTKSDDEWSVEYSNFAAIKDDSNYEPTNESITETGLNNLLDGRDE